MTTAAEARQIALALPEAVEEPHFDRTSFRLKGKIFATLPPGGALMVVKLLPEHAALLLDAEPDAFEANGWTKQGWLGVRLAAHDPDRIELLLRTAWRNVAPKRLAAMLNADQP